MPDGNITVILQGKSDSKLILCEELPYLTAKIKEVPEKRPKNDTEFWLFWIQLKS
jgi:ATP-dependent Lon protease